MQPNTNQSSFPKSKQWWRTPRLYLAAGIVFIVILLIVAIFISVGSQNNSKKAPDSSSAYYDRPGFDRKKLARSIGDPAALKLTQGSQPVSYQGAAVVQACSVFSPDDVRQVGLTMRPNGLTVDFSQTYFDGQGKATLKSPVPGLPLEDESNNCKYFVSTEDSAQVLRITVFQPAYTPASELEAELRDRYTQTGQQTGGLQTYQSTLEEGVNKVTTTVLRSGDSAISITSGLQDQAKETAVLEKAAANFKRLLATPNGPSRVSYDSPLLPNGAANACELLTASDIKTVFNEEASPLVNEAASTAVGVVTFGSAGGDTGNYNFAVHDCERRPIKSVADVESFTTRNLTLEARSFRDEKGAQEYLAAHKKLERELTPVEAKIGDEAFFAKPLGGGQLTVRQGRFILRLSNDDERPSKEQKIQQLVPVAQTVVSRLKL